MSGNKSNRAGIEQPGNWNNDVPEDFAKKDEKMLSPPKRRMRRATETPTRQNEHGGLVTATTAGSTYKNECADPEATREPISEPSEHNRAQWDEAVLESRNEREIDNGSTSGVKAESLRTKDEETPFFDENHSIFGASAATGETISDGQRLDKEDASISENGSVMEQESPTLENGRLSSPPANHDKTVRSLSQELADATGQSDGEGEYTAATNEDILPVDLSPSSPSISGDFAMSTAGQVGNNIVNSINAELSQSPEANIQDILRDYDFLKRELQSRDERMAAMRQECAFLKKELDSRDRMIAELEAENTALTNAKVRAIPRADASTNIETPTGQIWQPDYPREDDNERHFIAIKIPSLPPPAISLGAQTSTVLRFIQACLHVAKNLYLNLVSDLDAGSLPGQDLFLSCTRGSTSFKGAADFVQDWVQTAVVLLATPFWMAMSSSVYWSIQHEKSMWMQANALTRKQLLGHVSGVSGGWSLEMFIAFGSIMLYSRYH